MTIMHLPRVREISLGDAGGLVDVLERRRTLFSVQILFICLLSTLMQLTFWLRIAHVEADF